MRISIRRVADNVISRVRLARKQLSTTTLEGAVDLSETQRKRDYLRTMLGKDMAGERYLTRLVTAATTQHEHVQRLAAVNGCIALSSQNYNIPVISVKWGNSLELIKTELDAALGQAGNFGGECLLDFSGATSKDCDASTIISIKEHISNNKLFAPISIIGAVNCRDKSAIEQVCAAGLNVVNLLSRGSNSPALSAPSSTSQQHSLIKNANAIQPAKKSISAVAAMVHHGAVRSGQQIYAEGCSLIVIGSVNDGAEVLSDGDIHVYGALKGRAVAGLGGSQDARVFAHYFSPSLVGITDVFAMPDDCPALRAFAGKAVSVRLTRKGETVSESNDTNSTVVECGNNNRIVVSVLPLSVGS